MPWLHKQDDYSPMLLGICFDRRELPQAVADYNRHKAVVEYSKLVSNAIATGKVIVLPPPRQRRAA